MQTPINFYAVILAGGGGTRLWPKSRQKTPKHLLQLFGKDTLLKVTYERIAPIIPDERIFVITLSDHADLVKKQLPKIPHENIIIEPMQKNTALAMGAAASYIHSKDPSAVIINLAADQVIKDIKKFQNTALKAMELADKNDYIVAIGIRPTFVHTGLGYIKIGSALKDSVEDVFKSLGFKEKPDLATAQAFLTSGQYFWNANLYCWSTKTILASFKEHSPSIYSGLEKIIKAVGTGDEKNVMERVYSQSENIQIDYAISERVSNMVVVPGDFGWSDIGDWKVVYDTLAKDSDGNVILDQKRNYISVDTKNSLVETNSRLIVTVGVSDLVVIDCGDAILICSKDKTQDIKKAVEKLRLQKKDKYL